MGFILAKLSRNAEKCGISYAKCASSFKRSGNRRSGPPPSTGLRSACWYSSRRRSKSLCAALYFAPTHRARPYLLGALALAFAAGMLSVAMNDAIIGCPHQAGMDHEGAWCPVCEFWLCADSGDAAVADWEGHTGDGNYCCAVFAVPFKRKAKAVLPSSAPLTSTSCFQA